MSGRFLGIRLDLLVYLEIQLYLLIELVDCFTIFKFWFVFPLLYRFNCRAIKNALRLSLDNLDVLYSPRTGDVETDDHITLFTVLGR